MLRVSAIIQEARLDKQLELEDISKKIKVPVKYLRAIEDEASANFPLEPYCSLIVKDYAQYLGLDGQRILSLFRRDYSEKLKTKTYRPRLLSFTPKFTLGLAMVLSLVIFSAYLFYEYLTFNRPPNLKVDWPANLVVATSFFDLNGVTNAESTVRVNQDLVIVDHNGNFKKRIELSSSDETKVIVEAKSPSGKTTTDEKIIQKTAP